MICCPNQGTLRVKEALVIPQDSVYHGGAESRRPSVTCPLCFCLLPSALCPHPPLGSFTLLYIATVHPPLGLCTCCSPAWNAPHRLPPDVHKAPPASTSYTDLWSNVLPHQTGLQDPLSTPSYLPSLASRTRLCSFIALVTTTTLTCWVIYR